MTRSFSSEVISRTASAMISAVCVVIIAAVFANVVVADDKCDHILNTNCNLASEQVPGCGTNGRTFPNKCFFSKAHCLDNSINYAHDGDCVTTTSAPGSSTAAPSGSSSATTGTTATQRPGPTQTPIDGELIALDIFCMDLSYVQCGVSGPTVCGTDGNLYENLCEFDKARCYHRRIHANGTNCV